jgi:energy-coupling factor transporter transmembrane protein EcfT
MMADNGENPVVFAFKYVFAPLIELSGKLPPVLAYGLAVLIAFLVTVIVGAVIPVNLLWALIVVVLVVLAAFILVDWQTRSQSPRERSSIDHILNSSVLYVVVHEQGDQTSLIPEAQVTLALPEPVVKKTNTNGGTDFIISNQHIGKEFALNARKEGYKRREPVQVILRQNAYEFIPLEPEQVRERKPEVSAEYSEHRPEESPEEPKLIYDSQREEKPFISWGLFASDGRFYDHISIIRRPTDKIATFELKASPSTLVGVNKSLGVLYGRVEFEYRVVHSSAEGPNVFFYMIPMQETGPGRMGLIEVGTNVQDDPRNAFSSYRQKFVVPITYFRDSQWHHGCVEFDFRHTPDAFYSIFGPRINEGSVHPRAAHLLFTNVRVFSLR